MELMSFFGSAAFYVPLLVVAYWCLDPRVAARAAVFLSFGSVLNTVLKLFIHAPRPYWTDPSVTGREPISSFGMPSGHAQNSAVAWGFAATMTRRRVLWAGAGLMILLIGISRVYLGVHSVGQVIAGWAVGLVLLVVAIRLEPLVIPWWTRRTVSFQIALALAISLLCLGAAWSAVDSLEGWRWPSTWAHAIAAAGGHTRPITLNEAASATGGLFGILAGISLLGARGWFEAGGELWRRLARLGVGTAGALPIAALGLLLGPNPVGLFVLQALLGLWVSAGAPETFVELRLARRATLALTRPGDGRRELRQ